MARRRSNRGFTPYLFPFMSILTCTAGVLAFVILSMGLISVTAPSVVINMRVTQDAFRKHPIYLECQEDSLVFHPERIRVPRDSIILKHPVYEAFLEKMAEKSDQQYIVFTIYPKGELTFRAASDAIKIKNDQIAALNRKIEIGYEPLNKNWRLIFKKEE